MTLKGITQMFHRSRTETSWRHMREGVQHFIATASLEGHTVVELALTDLAADLCSYLGMNAFVSTLHSKREESMRHLENERGIAMLVAGRHNNSRRRVQARR